MRSASRFSVCLIVRDDLYIVVVRVAIFFAGGAYKFELENELKETDRGTLLAAKQKAPPLE
jgi:hypothetical protein